MRYLTVGEGTAQISATEPAFEGTRTVRFAERSVARFGKQTPARRSPSRGACPSLQGSVQSDRSSVTCLWASVFSPGGWW